MPGNPFPLSRSVAVIAEGIRGGGWWGVVWCGVVWWSGVEGENKGGVRKEAESVYQQGREQKRRGQATVS